MPSLEQLNKELKKKVNKFKNIVKVGRTHLQDATPLSLGQEFSGYQSQIEDCIYRIKNALNEIFFLDKSNFISSFNLYPAWSDEINIFFKLIKFVI